MKTKEKKNIPSSLVEPRFSPNALKVLERRYFLKDNDLKVIESPKELLWRIAFAVAKADAQYDKDLPAEKLHATAIRFYNMMADLNFLPNSPTIMNAGKDGGQLSACFVLPMEDSIVDIYDSIKNAAIIHKSGGGTGFSFSSLRPNNDIVSSTKGVSSGPLSFVRVIDASCQEIKQGGTRRGANMALLKVDHPDILEFIKCKSDLSQLNNFNISVSVTNEFMEAVKNNEEYPLINPRNGKVVEKLNAKEVFNEIVAQAWKTGEPGIVYIDKINECNPTPLVGLFESTNPCGEQPLLPYESCNLGSINLSNMVTADGKVDYDKLEGVIKDAVHFLDNVIDVNNYPLPEIDKMTKSNRKIGLGIMGFADMLSQMEIPYSTKKAAKIAEDVMSFLNENAFATSVELGRHRGAFPNFNKSIYAKNPDLPVRNATRTTIAPTGTLSILASCSSGIEPIFAVAFTKNVMDGEKLYEVNERFKAIAEKEGFFSEDLLVKIAENGGSVANLASVPKNIQKIFTAAHDISPEWHVDIQAVFQKHTDNAVSKTINFGRSATVEDIENAYLRAFDSGCKGLTIYRDGCRENQVLQTGKGDKKRKQEEAVTSVIPVKKERPKKLMGSTEIFETGCGSMYVTINQSIDGLQFELFNSLGKAGGCSASQCEALGRLVSLAWRYGIPAEPVVRQLQGISCHRPHGFGKNKIVSCADAIAQAIKKHLEDNGNEVKIEDHSQIGGACPECGGTMVFEGGCSHCLHCAASDCL